MNISKTKLLTTLSLLFFMAAGKPMFAVEGKLMVTTVTNFYDRWYKTIPQNPLENIPTAQTVYKRQVFYVLPLIGQVSLGKNRQPNITYTLTLKHAGKTVSIRKGVNGLKKKINDTAGVYLAETVLNFELGDTAKSGEYLIEAVITDHIAKTSITLTQTIQVTAYVYTPQPFTETDSFLVWQNYYYEGKGSGREIDGLMYLALPQNQENAERLIALLAFFADIFKGKNYLLVQLEKIYPACNADEKGFIINVLHLVDALPARMVKKFTKEEKKYYDDLKGYGLPYIPDSTVNNPVLLNMLWAKFFATGDYAHAKKLVEALELAKYEGSMAHYAESEKTEKDMEYAFYESVYQKLVIDMKQRLPNHPLLLGYCNFLLQYGRLPQITQHALGNVLAQP